MKRSNPIVMHVHATPPQMQGDADQLLLSAVVQVSFDRRRSRSDVENIRRWEARTSITLDRTTRRLSHLRRALTPQGRLLIVGGETDGRWLGGTDRQLRAHLLSPFVKQKLGTFISSENAEDLIALRDLIEAGKVTPVIDRTYPLSDVPTAIRHLVDGHTRGKIVITV